MKRFSNDKDAYRFRIYVLDLAMIFFAIYTLITFSMFIFVLFLCSYIASIFLNGRDLLLKLKWSK